MTLNCILSHRDRGRSSRERGLQASPRPFLGLFLGFSFSYLLFPLPVRRVDRGPAPRYNERRTFWFRFILAAQLPATVSDGLYSSTSLSSLCDYFVCCSLPLRYADFLQNFCSAEICTTSLHQQGRDLFVHSLFNIFFSRNDFFNQRFRGAEGESYPQSPPAGAFLLKKEKRGKKIL